MKTRFFFLILASLALAVSCGNKKNELVRPASVAGAFYPAQPSELNSMIDQFLVQVPEEKIPGDIVALIVPHAGYVYSGQVAAYGYKLLAGRHFDSVILIGPSHHSYVNVASIWQEGSWETPLGKVSVDRDLARAIAGENELFQCIRDPHLNEHSLEVQLPFLQKTLKDFKIVPILLSDPTPDNCRLLAQAIVKQLKPGKKVLVIASSDMSHYYTDEQARSMDSAALDLLSRSAEEALTRALASGTCEFCGRGAVLTVMEIAKLLAPVKVKVLKYANSGDATGDRARVVGYSASVFYKENKIPEKGKDMLNKTQQKELLKIARQTIESYIRTGTVPEVETKDPALKEKRGVFVTLQENGSLRGCIGYIMPIDPLDEAVSKMAIESATGDPRFKPVTAAELPQLHIEISVLSVPVCVKNAADIILGTHGVIVRKGGQGGVFLPQVATETGWTKEEFLNELCSQKAGLPADAWKNKDCELYTFTAQVFQENEP
jgi:MEMO1 family protein